jgi:ubiquinol-cytochrome c reductase cytochrome c1 subunit
MRLITLAAAGFATLALGAAGIAFAAEGESTGAISPHHLDEPAGGWSFEGLTGTFDQNALQRGYKVYREVCSSCHGMKLMSFRNLGQKGGPFYDPEYPNPGDNPRVKALAAELQMPDIDHDTGDAIQRTGFVDPPAGLKVNGGQHYNRVFPGDTGSQWSGDPRLKPVGGFLAMAPPLKADGQVTFDDDTPSTVKQMAKDVATFLAWASEPKQETRRQMGVAVVGYLAIFAVIVFLSYRRIWRNVEH